MEQTISSDSFRDIPTAWCTSSVRSALVDLVLVEREMEIWRSPIASIP
jgi:hypothetical protein